MEKDSKVMTVFSIIFDILSFVFLILSLILFFNNLDILLGQSSESNNALGLIFLILLGFTGFIFSALFEFIFGLVSFVICTRLNYHEDCPTKLRTSLFVISLILFILPIILFLVFVIIGAAK